MANRFRQFRQLLWKNFLLQKRRPIGTAFEIGIPIVVMGILILIPLADNDRSQDEKICFSLFTEKTLGEIIVPHGEIHQFKKLPLAFYPATKTVAELMARVENITGVSTVNRSIATGKQWSSAASMAVEISANENTYVGAIEFYIGEESKLPKQVRYAIHLSGYWSTDAAYPSYPSPGPRRWSAYEYGFLPLQYAVDMAIIQNHDPINSEHLIPVKMKQFPYPGYTKRKFDWVMLLISIMMPLLVTLGLMYSSMTIIKELVMEKQNRLKESMKMMGLANWIHWSAWFTKNLLFLLITGIVMVIVLKVLVFTHSDGSVIFVFFLLYLIATILFCFCVSVFFSRPVLGMLFGALIWIATLVPYFVIFDDDKYRSLTRSQKAGACLLPNTCLGIAGKTVYPV
ncbi:hypothetical protein OS493_016818 [Desmophyllum pertusum]|uniref:ABC-2 type transporter transmembrane domain-containing protein n=1 Tax=Desmophyllum pertusum TaxID=174260 RepID=A0A9W9Z1Z8_9CNID|nr:hypothetical protein OS493_016818 [Desmophyllum pertusum]